MNASLTNSTLLQLMDIQLQNIADVLMLAIQMINFSLGIPLYSYVIFVFTRARGLDESVFFIVGQCVSEIIYALGALQYVSCTVNSNACFFKVLGFFYGFFISAHPVFQCFICLEHYLAVVHPLAFLKFKALRYRMACLTMIWIYVLGCSIAGVFTFPNLPADVYGGACLTVLVIKLFCCASILRALRLPGPGEEEHGRKNTKKKAFDIVFINLLTYSLHTLTLCVAFGVKHIVPYEGAFYLASSSVIIVHVVAGLVQVLFYLYKAGKLTCLRALCSKSI